MPGGREKDLQKYCFVDQIDTIGTNNQRKKRNFEHPGRGSLD